jgi:hypothetical protein
MTDHETEVVPTVDADVVDDADMTAAKARELTDRIKAGIEEIWKLIERAYVERAWKSLGYSNWDDYCQQEFAKARLRLPREERSEVVCSMRDVGMSIRAITSATGLGTGTVHRELSGEPNGSPAESGDGAHDDKVPGVPNGTPEPESATITGLDGKSYPATRPKPDPVADQPETGGQTDHLEDQGAKQPGEDVQQGEEPLLSLEERDKLRLVERIKYCVEHDDYRQAISPSERAAERTAQTLTQTADNAQLGTPPEPGQQPAPAGVDERAAERHVLVLGSLQFLTGDLLQWGDEYDPVQMPGADVERILTEAMRAMEPNAAETYRSSPVASRCHLVVVGIPEPWVDWDAPVSERAAAGLHAPQRVAMNAPSDPAFPLHFRTHNNRHVTCRCAPVPCHPCDALCIPLPGQSRMHTDIPAGRWHFWTSPIVLPTQDTR